MRRIAALLAGTVLSLALAPGAAAQDDGTATTSADTSNWSAVVLPQTADIAALASGVAVGPTSIVVVGQRACKLRKRGDLGRCWGQPWISPDGVTWEAVEARSSGLDLGTFTIATSGPEIGIDGVAHGPAGFVAFGWARPDVTADRGYIVPALWRSVDGRSWERIPTPESFVVTDGLMLPGPWLRTIVGNEAGYLLGGTIFGKPAPQAAIWSSPDGLTWTLAESDEVFDVGAYIDTMEIPAAGGIGALAVAPAGSAGSVAAIGVGPVCPEAKQGAGPRRGFREFDWTTGVCRPHLWHTTDGLTWETGDLGRASGYPMSAAGNTLGWVIDLTTGDPDGDVVVFSADTFAWEDAAGGPIGQQGALTATDDAFHVLIQTCENERCRRKGLDLWSSPDGLTWSQATAQPTLPEDIEDFMRVSAAAAGDRIVVAAGYWAAGSGDLASMVLLSPASTAADGATSPGSPAPPDA